MAKSINDAGGKAIAIPGDMLDAAYIGQLVEKAAEFGGGKIHIIVNNAGYTWDGVIHKVILPFLCSMTPKLDLYSGARFALLPESGIDWLENRCRISNGTP